MKCLSGGAVAHEAAARVIATAAFRMEAPARIQSTIGCSWARRSAARRLRQVALDTAALLGIERGDEKMWALLETRI
jgi:hypothetical protein